MTVLLPSLAFELVTAEEMTRRRVRFIEKLNGGYQGPIIIAEGDSWFCYPRDSIWVPDTAPVDVITQLSQEFAISALGRPGDTSQARVMRPPGRPANQPPFPSTVVGRAMPSSRSGVAVVLLT